MQTRRVSEAGHFIQTRVHLGFLSSGKYRAFFQTHENVGFKTAIIRQKTRKFLLCNKSKMFHCSRKDAPWTQITTD